ncbi:hypothetical protein BABINDRAFT_5295 [Babjeviella inositovora NRRL Y-12698]|uniref:RecQ mediated genome instability protein 1 OB-fold domain-containing protein n=1 Tax=Babjeviella inositovora NRRL Y-12698 TaxID=984486 RepID=A0A1E3QYY8_9ASCO|nr:uncharacterized protein BABINDRAFT_5295 [Babjeviella inositovora NRRL Y-12698]ODQ82302.1 hypothetical protein BABINDRAFT_5295 [Babjeviella inositovora NRRL Y-12698]
MNYLLLDITSPALRFPPAILAPSRTRFPFQLAINVPDEANLPQATLFQVVDICNITELLITQLDNWEALHDPSSVSVDKLRNAANTGIIRNVDLDASDQPIQGPPKPSSSNNRTRTFKLTLQDTLGALCYGFEMEKLAFLAGQTMGSDFPITLGAKLVVKSGTLMVKGVLFLTNASVEFLGGEIPALNVDLAKRQIERLKQEIQAEKNKTPS